MRLSMTSPTFQPETTRYGRRENTKQLLLNTGTLREQAKLHARGRKQRRRTSTAKATTHTRPVGPGAPRRASALLLLAQDPSARVARVHARRQHGHAPRGARLGPQPGHGRPLAVAPGPQVLRRVQAPLPGVGHKRQPPAPVLRRVQPAPARVLLRGRQGLGRGVSGASGRAGVQANANTQVTCPGRMLCLSAAAPACRAEQCARTGGQRRRLAPVPDMTMVRQTLTRAADARRSTRVAAAARHGSALAARARPCMFRLQRPRAWQCTGCSLPAHPADPDTDREPGRALPSLCCFCSAHQELTRPTSGHSPCGNGKHAAASRGARRQARRLAALHPVPEHVVGRGRGRPARGRLHVARPLQRRQLRRALPRLRARADAGRLLAEDSSIQAANTSGGRAVGCTAARGARAPTEAPVGTPRRALPLRWPGRQRARRASHAPRWVRAGADSR